jgi:hypothetical protein
MSNPDIEFIQAKLAEIEKLRGMGFMVSVAPNVAKLSKALAVGVQALKLTCICDDGTLADCQSCKTISKIREILK